MSEEAALIRSFVIASKQDRYIGFLANPKRRTRATAALYHLRDLDPRYVVTIAGNQQNAGPIEHALRARGAGDTCHVVSTNTVLDGKRLPLAEALDAVIGLGSGTLLSCVPGKLGYYEGEGPSDRCILARKGPELSRRHRAGGRPSR
jgi:hypothetical protein